MILQLLSIPLLLDNVYSQSTCSIGLDGYHVILDPLDITPASARAACQSFGWEYAIIQPSTWQSAAWTVGNCTALSVGIWSFHGIVADLNGGGCQFMQASGVFAVGVSGFECVAVVGRLPVLCQDEIVASIGSTLAVATTLATTTTTTIPLTQSTTTITTSTQTITNTITNKSGLQRPRDFTTCAATINGLRLLYGPFECGQAAAACQHANPSWQLAQLGSVSDIAAARALWQSCQPEDATAWIQSADVIPGGQCQFMYRQSDTVFWAVVGMGEQPCQLATAMVLCQDSTNGGAAGGPPLLSTGMRQPTLTRWSSTLFTTIVNTVIVSVSNTITLTIRSTTSTRTTATTTVSNGNLLSSLLSIIGGLV